MKDTANWLLKKRVEKNLTQKELADLLGITQGSVAHIESGIRLPSLPVAYKLSVLLDFDMSDFIELSEVEIVKEEKEAV